MRILLTKCPTVSWILARRFLYALHFLPAGRNFLAAKTVR